MEPMNIAWCVQRWSEISPDKTAIIYDEQRISYLQLNRRVQRTCLWLQSQGIEKGDRVALMSRNRPEFIDIYLACSRLGIIFVPVNFRLTGRELGYTLENSSPKILIFEDERRKTIDALDLMGSDPCMILIDLDDRANDREFPDCLVETKVFEGRQPLFFQPPEPIDPEEPQIIMYTSGTTGRPKGAVLQHQKTYFNCLNADIFCSLQPEDIMLITLPLFHSGGLFIQATPILFKGGTMIIHHRFDPERVCQDIERYGVTKITGVPTIYRQLLNVEKKKRGDLSSIKVSTIGGENCTIELLGKCREIGFPLRQIMGQTETSIFLWASEKDLIRKPGTIGRPVFHTDLAIVDEAGNPVKPGEVGQILIRGPIMMKEYWQDPVKTEETIKNGWLYTGDLARMDEEGYFYLVDRAKDMYISGGENVYPAEVEKVMREHPDIEDIAVVGISDNRWGEVGRAFVIPKKSARLSAEEMLSYVEGRLARYKWPKEIVFRDDFPRTASGKVKKYLLDMSNSVE